MKHFKRILASTDLSPESLSTVTYAGHLARGQGAKLTVCYVPPRGVMTYSHIMPPADMIAMDAEVRQAAQERLDAWVRKHLSNVPNVAIVFGDGVPEEEICRIAEDVGASLIVMATHGRKGFGRMMVGSVTERVIRNASCPVLVIRPPKPAGAKKAAKRPRS
jgi:nucleotide-binding universal stress UspA family protein